MTRNKGMARFRAQSRRCMYNMSTSAGARDGMRYQEYAANVRAQKGFTTQVIHNLRRSWLAVSSDKRKPWHVFLEHQKLPG